MMTYVTIKEATNEKLHFVREPTLRSWAILFGLIALGFGAAYYSGDYTVWKIAYVCGAVFVGLTVMEDWEECLLDKDAKKVTITRQTLVQKIFQATQGHKVVVGDLEDIVSVDVQAEEVKYSGVGYMVVLHFGAGYSLTVTETSPVGDSIEQEQIAKKITTFLELDENKSNECTPLVDLPSDFGVSATVKKSEKIFSPGTPEAEILLDSAVPTHTAELSSTDDSDDSFEQIDKAEIANLSETGDTKKCISEDSGNLEDK